VLPPLIHAGRTVYGDGFQGAGHAGAGWGVSEAGNGPAGDSAVGPSIDCMHACCCQQDLQPGASVKVQHTHITCPPGATARPECSPRFVIRRQEQQQLVPSMYVSHRCFMPPVAHQLPPSTAEQCHRPMCFEWRATRQEVTPGRWLTGSVIACYGHMVCHTMHTGMCVGVRGWCCYAEGHQ
jgi:hypothetical protein